tara:strand:- start:1449 stop:1865 length:417 start_codon:yes stop_codon:yes gene_type:complete
MSDLLTKIIQHAADSEAANGMLDKSGMTWDDVFAGNVRDHFLDTVCGLVAINSAKSVGYGDYIEERKDDSMLFQAIQTHTEIRRKWIRFDSLVKAIAEDPNSPSSKAHMESIKDQLSDMAVYSVMLLEIYKTFTDDNI